MSARHRRQQWSFARRYPNVEGVTPVKCRRFYPFTARLVVLRPARFGDGGHLSTKPNRQEAGLTPPLGVCSKSARMTHYEGGSRRRTAGEHSVQLFDSAECLADTVAASLRERLLHGDALLVVTTAAHWTAIESRLLASHVLVRAAQASGQLTVKDAAAALATFMVRDRIDPRLFDEKVGALVRRLRTRGCRLWIFGEMVDVLIARGEFAAAEALEVLWNELAERVPFTLFCGYSSEHFGNPAHAENLRTICRAHSHVRTNPRDVLGGFLLDVHGVTPCDQRSAGN